MYKSYCMFSFVICIFLKLFLFVLSFSVLYSISLKNLLGSFISFGDVNESLVFFQKFMKEYIN